MRAKILVKRISTYFMVIALMIAVCVQYASAFSTIDLSSKGDISITEAFETKNKTYYLSEIEIKLWRVADVTSGARFKLTDEFKASEIKVRNLTSSQWQEAADGLLSYAQNQEISAEQKKTTGTDGTAVFGDITPGLYLAAPSNTSLIHSGYYVKLEKAMLISVPYQTEGDGEWIYSVPVKAKNEVVINPGSEPEPEPEEPDEPTNPGEDSDGLPPEKDSDGLPPERNSDGLPPEKDYSHPKTGDVLNAKGYMLALVLSSAGIIALIAAGKKKEREER